MLKTVDLKLPIPPSSNVYWRMFRGRIIVSAEAREYKKWMPYYANYFADPIAGPVALRIKVCPADNRRDLDNFQKVLLDAMQKVIYVNDKLVRAIYIRFGEVNKDDPHVQVQVRELPPPPARAKIKKSHM